MKGDDEFFDFLEDAAELDRMETRNPEGSCLTTLVLPVLLFGVLFRLMY